MVRREPERVAPVDSKQGRELGVVGASGRRGKPAPREPRVEQSPTELDGLGGRLRRPLVERSGEQIALHGSELEQPLGARTLDGRGCEPAELTRQLRHEVALRKRRATEAAESFSDRANLDGQAGSRALGPGCLSSSFLALREAVDDRRRHELGRHVARHHEHRGQPADDDDPRTERPSLEVPPPSMLEPPQAHALRYAAPPGLGCGKSAERPENAAILPIREM
jgi:hypothetical protein